jgi:hypothetical protein
MHAGGNWGRVGRGVRLRTTSVTQWIGLAGVILGIAGILGSMPTARGQALPTASQSLSLSAFGGTSGIQTGIKGGRNLSITAGADVTFWHFFAGLRPTAEVRGTYPVDDGRVNGQKSILAGLRIDRRIRRFHLYGDFLVGRGELNYLNGLSRLYLYTDSTVYSPGLGVEYDLTRHFAFRADGQDQRWSTPANSSGVAWSKQGTLAVTYRFDFNRR